MRSILFEKSLPNTFVKTVRISDIQSGAFKNIWLSRSYLPFFLQSDQILCGVEIPVTRALQLVYGVVLSIMASDRRTSSVYSVDVSF